MHEKIEEMAKNYGKDVKDLENNETVRNYIELGVRTEKALELVVDNAKLKAPKKTTTKKETKTSKGSKKQASKK